MDKQAYLSPEASCIDLEPGLDICDSPSNTDTFEPKPGTWSVDWLEDLDS